MGQNPWVKFRNLLKVIGIKNNGRALRLSSCRTMGSHEKQPCAKQTLPACDFMHLQFDLCAHFLEDIWTQKVGESPTTKMLTCEENKFCWGAIFVVETQKRTQTVLMSSVTRGRLRSFFPLAIFCAYEKNKWNESTYEVGFWLSISHTPPQKITFLRVFGTDRFELKTVKTSSDWTLHTVRSSSPVWTSWTGQNLLSLEPLSKNFSREILKSQT